MKRQRPQQGRRPAPAPQREEESEEEPEQAPFEAQKRPKMLPHHHHSSSGDEEDSGDAQSDSELSSSEDEGGSQDEDEGLPLGQLVELRQDGSTSGAAMKARAREVARQARAVKAAGEGGVGSGKADKRGKHMPMEMSSKRPVPVLREALQGGKRHSRDPRFESLSAGQYKEEQFKRRYAFLYDDRLPAEREELKGAIKKAKGAGPKAQLQARLTQVEQQLRSEEARRKQEGFKEKVKATERTAVRAGKAPFYLKKSEQRRLELLAKYEELQASGKLDKFLEKRRKKNAAKDHRYLPSTRRQD